MQEHIVFLFKINLIKLIIMKNLINSIILLYTLILLTSCSNNNSTNNEPQDPDPEVIVCGIIEHNNTSGNELDENVELPLLEEVYANFEEYTTNKDAASFNGILLHNNIPLFITGKETTGIVSLTMNGPQFVNYIINDPNPHELQISNAEFSIFKGVATSWANYEEVIGSNTVGTGIDLFFYVNTNEGWKLTTTNNTYLLPGDTTDYETTEPMTEEPSVVLNNMAAAFNSKNRSSFLSNFKSESTFFVLSEVFSQTYSNNTHTPQAFIDCALDATNSYTLSIANDEIEIRDQYLAKVKADYVIAQSGTDIETGKMIMTMIGTPSGGWKISAAALTY